MRIIDGVITIKALFNDLRLMSCKQKANFYKAKCEYYQGIVELSLVLTCLITICFLYSDYMINGSVLPTLIPRLSILGYIAIFFIVTHVNKNTRVWVFMDYFLGHGLVLAAIWTAYNLVDRSNSATGIVLVNILWLAIGFVSTHRDSIVNGIVFIIEICVSNTFIHYSNYEVILSLEIPCIIGIVVVHFIMTAFYLDHYKLTQKLELSMVTDSLTQVYNRHLLESIVSDNSLKDISPNENTSIAMMDIDDFKKINDENGHYTGDVTLVYIGQKLSQWFKDDGYVIRYGGEEFVVILNNFTLDEARDRMDKFRVEIENATDTPVPFTISVGVSSYTGDYGQTIRNVDDALYEAKNTGKNKVVVK